MTQLDMSSNHGSQRVKHGGQKNSIYKTAYIHRIIEDKMLSGCLSHYLLTTKSTRTSLSE